MLDVDEIETTGLRPLGRYDEILHQPLDLVVADDRAVGRIAELAIQQRMAIGDDRFELGIVVRLAETARMGELQTDDDIVAVFAGRFLVRGDDAFAHLGDVALALLGHDELLGIGAAVGAHRTSLAAPQQLGAGQAEAPPATFGILGRAAVALAVPAFHRMNGKTMTDGHAVEFKWRPERRLRTMRDDVVAGQVEPERLDVVTKSGDAVERTSLGIIAELHASSELTDNFR